MGEQLVGRIAMGLVPIQAPDEDGRIWLCGEYTMKLTFPESLLDWLEGARVELEGRRRKKGRGKQSGQQQILYIQVR